MEEVKLQRASNPVIPPQAPLSSSGSSRMSLKSFNKHPIVKLGWKLARNWKAISTLTLGGMHAPLKKTNCSKIKIDFIVKTAERCPGGLKSATD